MDKNIKGNILGVRLYQGEDFIVSLKEAFGQTGKSLGIVLSAAGMMRDIKLGYFIGRGEYKENIYDRPRETVAVTGNLINNGEEIFAHLHVALADDDGKVAGGHLQEAAVHGTGEVFIYLSDMEVTRELEEQTGLKGLKL